MDTTDETGDFDYSTLEYDPCSVVQAEPKPYRNECISTNISGIVASGKKDDGNVSYKGLVLASALDGVIKKYTGYISGKAIVNGDLSWPIMIKNILNYRRPLIEAKFYQEYLAFVKEWPSREWKGKICMSCDDIDTFNMEDLVMTVLAWGEVHEAEFKEPDGELSLTVYHQ